MRSSIPLSLHLAVGLRPMWIFAKTVLREQAPERSSRESYTRGPPCAARYRCAASRCRASPYGNIYQKTASQASLHAAFRQIFPHGSTFAHFFKNPLAFSGNTRYNTSCCDMIAVKREVAAARQVFPWSECQEAGTLPGRETWRQVTVQTIRSVDIQKQPLWKSPKEGYDEPWRSQNVENVQV